MEYLRGSAPAAPTCFAQLIGAPQVLIDLGTGDGRFVQHMARANPAWQIIGIDACREQLRSAVRKAPANAKFVIANALALPQDLYGVATYITINFPWGSLLRGLLDEQQGVIRQIAALARPKAVLDIRLNAGALAEADWSFERGVEQVRQTLVTSGFSMDTTMLLDTKLLRALPSTWAKRLAFGRDPRACHLRAERR